MKYFLLTAFILLNVTCHAQMWQEKDKQLHFAGTALITTSTAGYLHWHGVKKHHAAMSGIAAGIAAGLVKELLIDKKYDARDMKANIAGCAVGGVVMVIPINKKRK
jgi:uncharacterized protein YfiM (DUF2279 family)